MSAETETRPPKSRALPELDAEQEIDLGRYGRRLLKRWWMLVLGLVIGVTTYLQPAQTGVWNVRASFLPAIYLEGVTLAGGIPLLLPPQPVDAEIAARVLDSLDALVLTGGRDVDRSRVAC